MTPDTLRLYLVADPDHCRGSLVDAVADALAGGTTIVQLRAKSLTDRELLQLARACKAACDERSIPFLINDRVDIALACGASGVHLGVDDLPVPDARRLLGPDAIIGYSPDTVAQITEAAKGGADYLGVGPVFGTSTKPDAGAALGLNEFARRARLTSLPVVGIGGITCTNADAVMGQGAAGISVISAILDAASPRAAAASLRRHVEERPAAGTG